MDMDVIYVDFYTHLTVINSMIYCKKWYKCSMEV